jgi:LPS export ABC transporter protein LptC
MNHRLKISPQIILISIVSLCLTITSCRSWYQNVNQNPAKAPVTEQSETRLTLQNVTLEQSNEKGEIIWKLKSNTVTYSQDNQEAKLEKVIGNLFQDGKLILKVQADQGLVEKNGENIFLKQNILVTDQRNGATFQGDEAEWKPEESLLFVRHNLKATHPTLEASAEEGTYNSREETIELKGKIVATSKDPKLQIKTELMTWLIEDSKIISNTKIQLDRYENNSITDRLFANKGEIELKNKLILLRENIELKSVEPPLQVATNMALWNYKHRQIKFEQPVTILHLEDKTNVTGNQGQIDLAKNLTHLWGGVIGLSPSNQAKLTANELRWQMGTQVMEAQGNVTYQQPDPPLNLTGPKAVGRLHDNSIVVTSSPTERVVTRIIPEEN